MPARTTQPTENQDTITWHLKESIAGPLIRLSHLGERKSFKKGTYLYQQEEISSVFYFILSGRVQVSILDDDGNEFILEVMGEWALCGEADAFKGYPRFSNALALDDVEVVAFDFEHIQQFFASHPELAVSLLTIASIKQRVLGVRLQHLASPKPEKRITELLSRLADLYGQSERGVIKIGIRLTHEQIAAMTGSSRVTVTRTLRRLRDKGVIDVRDRMFHILDAKQLM